MQSNAKQVRPLYQILMIETLGNLKGSLCCCSTAMTSKEYRTSLIEQSMREHLNSIPESECFTEPIIPVERLSTTIKV